MGKITRATIFTPQINHFGPDIWDTKDESLKISVIATTSERKVIITKSDGTQMIYCGMPFILEYDK